MELSNSTTAVPLPDDAASSALRSGVFNPDWEMGGSGYDYENARFPREKPPPLKQKSASLSVTSYTSNNAPFI